MRIKRWRYAAAGLSVMAGLVHTWVTPAHFAEWWGYGLFFIVAAFVQVFFGMILLTGERRWLYPLGIAGNAAIIALYFVTRTVGIPFFGPQAGRVEPVAFVDIVSKSIELSLIGVLVALLRQPATLRVTATSDH